MGKTHRKTVMAGVCCLMISMLTGCGNNTTKITEGMQLIETLDYQGALTYFQSAMEMENISNKQELMRAMIVAYEKSGDFASAKSMMADYAEAYPDDAAAQRENIFLQTR